MRFIIADGYIRKRGPIYCSIWGILIGSIFFLSEEIPLVLSFGLLIFVLALSGGSNWRELKKFLAFVENHYVEVINETFVELRDG